MVLCKWLHLYPWTFPQVSDLGPFGPSCFYKAFLFFYNLKGIHVVWNKFWFTRDLLMKSLTLKNNIFAYYNKCSNLQALTKKWQDLNYWTLKLTVPCKSTFQDSKMPPPVPSTPPSGKPYSAGGFYPPGASYPPGGASGGPPPSAPGQEHSPPPPYSHSSPGNTLCTSLPCFLLWFIYSIVNISYRPGLTINW